MLAVGVGVGTYRRLRFSVAEGAAKVGGLDVRMADLRRYIEEQNSQLAQRLSPIEDVQDEMTRLGGRFEDVAAQTNELGSRSDAQANLFETLSQTVELSSARIDATATEVDQLAERVLANVRETERLVALQARLIHAMVSKSNELDPEGGNIEYADAAVGGHD